jgi:hypothetical protein
MAAGKTGIHEQTLARGPASVPESAALPAHGVIPVDLCTGHQGTFTSLGNASAKDPGVQTEPQLEPPLGVIEHGKTVASNGCPIFGCTSGITELFGSNGRTGGKDPDRYVALERRFQPRPSRQEAGSESVERIG